MEKKLPMWKPIKMGDRLPCQSFLRKKNGEILKLSTVAGVTVGQDAYYLPVDDVIEEIKNYPIEESEDEKMIKYFKDLAPFDKAEELYEKYGFSHKDAISWLEKQGEQKHQYNSRPRYVGEEELLGTNKQGKCPFSKQELIDMGFAFTQDGDLAYPIHKIEKKEFATWSEEDEEIHRKCICAMRASACGFPEEEKFVEQVDNWLKSLKERVQPQPKQEWSEEDKIHLHSIESTIEYCKRESAEAPLVVQNYNKDLDWLKSLKDRFTWKPSEEHYELKEFAKIVRGNLTGISKAVQKLFEAKYLQLTGNKMYGGFKD